MTRTSLRPRPRLRPTVDRLEDRALMAFAGGLDSSFGTAGLTVVSQPVGSDASDSFTSTPSIALEPDGSILMARRIGDAGATTGGLFHFTAAGAPDTSYGTAGVAQVALPAGYVVGSVGDVLVQSDGKPVLVVEALLPTGAANAITIVERFNTDGTPDATYGSAGQVILSSTSGIFTGVSFSLKEALGEDGKLLLTGSVADTALAGNSDILVTRLGLTGSVDSSFGTGGMVILSGIDPSKTGASLQTPSAIAVQPNGQILVAGTLAYRVSFFATITTAQLFRLNTDGTKDASLSAAGLQSTPLNGPAALAVQPNGQILVMGNYVPSLSTGPYLSGILARLNADGSFNYVITLPTSADLAGGTGIGLQANGDIVVTTGPEVNYTVGSVGSSFQVVRLTPNLARDATFGLGGIATVPVPFGVVSSSQANNGFTPSDGITVTSSGQIVTGGIAFVLSTSTGITAEANVVTQLTTTGTSARPGDFDGDGIADPAIYLPAAGAFAIAYSSGIPSQLIPFGGPGLGTTIPATGNYDGTGKQEIGAYLPALGVYAYHPAAGGSDVYYKLGTPGPGLTIPAPGDYYGTGRDDVAVYLADLGAFAIVDPTGQTPGEIIPFGSAGVGASIPAPGDYFGTGHDDLAVYLPAAGAFAIADPAGVHAAELVPFGGPGLGTALPMPGDYDGSGKTELAVYLPAYGLLAYRPANGGSDVYLPFGGPGVGTVLPMAADYTGSGKTEPGVYIPALGELVYRPPTGPDVAFAFGSPGLGQTIPVTSVVLFTSELGITGPNPGTVSALAFEVVPNIAGGFEPLEFGTASKKAKSGTVLV